MKKLVAWIFTVVFMISCDTSEPVVYSESKEFPGNAWQRFRKLNFRVPVEEPDDSYNFFFTFEYDSAYPYDNLPIHAILNIPGGEERVFTFELAVRDSTGVEHGKWSSEANRFYLRSKLWQSIGVTQQGQFRLSVEQLIPKIKTPGIHRAGIEVTKAGE